MYVYLFNKQFSCIYNLSTIKFYYKNVCTYMYAAYIHSDEIRNM